MSSARSIAPHPTRAALAQAADRVAARHVFANYRSRKSPATLERQDDDIQCFATFLQVLDFTVDGDLSTTPAAWQGITFGLVEGFVRWMLSEGFSTQTVNVRLSTIKCYIGLATQAHAVPADVLALVRTVRAYKRTEARRIDAQRAEQGLPTRLGDKKAEALPISPEQAHRLKTEHPSTPQGMRDALLMCILLELGVRVTEACGIQRGGVNLAKGTITFYRPKVDLVQTHQMPALLARAMTAYIQSGAAPTTGPLLRRSLKNGSLGKAGLTRNGVYKRVQQLGVQVSLFNLSPHDCRHHWATQAAANHTPIDRLKEGGGWSSPAMPLRYIQREEIANEGVILEKTPTNELKK